MTRQAKLALAVWMLLAIVVFNVRFDWQTRTAGFAFTHAQLARQKQGLPPVSIHDGFRPLVRQAAVDSSAWPAVIAIGGALLVIGASRRHA